MREETAGGGGEIREKDLTSINRTIEELASNLSEPVMKSSARLTILIALAMNRKMIFSDLMEMTSIGKGSLSNHLEKLESYGLIESKTVFRPAGPRVLLKITQKGIRAYEIYRRLLMELIKFEQ